MAGEAGEQEPLKGDAPKAAYKTPKAPPFLACITSGYVRLICLIWAAYTLTILAATWYDVTWYHVGGEYIRNDNSTWGQVYDVTRVVSKTGITAATAASDMTAGNKVDMRIDDDEFEIVEDNFEQPEGWQAGLIHGWMIIITTVNILLASVVWLIVFKNALVTICGVKRFDANEKLREHRQELAADIALLWQLLVPFMCWVIQKLTGYANVGINHRLYAKMMAIGPLVLMGQKLMVFFMNTLKDSQFAMNRSGELAWALCSSKHKDKEKTCRNCAIDIFEKSYVLTRGPILLQRVVGGAMMGAVFQERPFGLVLGILGLVDELIVSRLALKVLSVIPTWIDEDIAKMEEKIAAVGADVLHARRELIEHMRKVKGFLDEGSLLLLEAHEHLNHAREITQKEHLLLGPSMTKNMEETIDKVMTPITALRKELDAADKEVGIIEARIEKEANAVVAQILEMIKSLTKLLDCLRPENVMARLEDLAADAIYGEVLAFMEKSKVNGAAPLEFDFGGGAA